MIKVTITFRDDTQEVLKLIAKPELYGTWIVFTFAEGQSSWYPGEAIKKIETKV